MKVFVAGATGALGVPLVQELKARGHDVVGLARSDANEATLKRLGVEARRADLFDADSLAKAAEGADVVVRAATHIPTSRGTAQDWALNDRIRREGTRALLEAAGRVGARGYVQESIVWLARPDDGKPFHEASPPRPDAMTASALDAEEMAQKAAATGFATTTLRLGWLYGPHTAHTRFFAQELRRRRLPIIGRGDAPLAFLHVDDAARAFATAVEKAPGGVWHVVDERPTGTADFFRAFAMALAAPRPMRIPLWLGRLAAGDYVARFLTTPMVTSNERFRKATGWRPKHATVYDGLSQVVAEWRVRGGGPF